MTTDRNEKLTGLDIKKYKQCVMCKKILPLAHFNVSSVNTKGTKFYKSECILCEENKQRKQATLPDTMKILDSDGNMKVINEENIVTNENPVVIPLLNVYEVFVQIEDTYNYWVSNYGRVINNLRNPKKFYLHNMTNHYTINFFDKDGSIRKEDINTDKLVAKHFLKNPNAYSKIWHLDGDESNNYYKNLIYLSYLNYQELKKKKITIEEIEVEQEYYEYVNKARGKANAVWSGIYNRCYKKEKCDSIHECYENVVMCDEWKDNADSFIDWYLKNYYSVPGESMTVDKDLFSNGLEKVYSPDNCCILPQTINTMLTNCKKHKPSKGKSTKMELPLGVRYDERLQMYYGQIMPFGHDESINLAYWNTPEEAFEEYKQFKQADIMMMAAKYKNKIPKHIYEALLKVVVKPYVE